MDALRIFHAIRPRYLGIAFLFSWNAIVNVNLLADPWIEFLIRFMPYALCFILWKPLSSVIHRQIIVVPLSIVAVAVTLFSFGYESFLMGSEIGYPLAILSKNTVIAILLVSWCDAYSGISLSDAAKHLGWSFVLVALMYAGLIILPREALLGLGMLCIPISLSCIASCLAQNTVRRPSTHSIDVSHVAMLSKSTTLLWRLTLVYSACSFGSSITRIHSSTSTDIIAMAMGGILLLLCLAASPRKNIFPSLAFAIAAMMAAMCLGVILDLLGNTFSALSGNIGLALSTATMMIYLCDRQSRFDMPAACSFAFVKCISAIFSALGLAVSKIASTSPAPLFAQTALAIATVILCLIAMGIWLRFDEYEPNDLDNETSETQRSNPPICNKRSKQDETDERDSVGLFKSAISHRCKRIGDEYGLSKRELEILGYLAMGWSVPRIEMELVLSRSTIKTHVRHIYRKLGIHSRVELNVLIGIE